MRARSRPVPQLPGRHCLSDLPRLPPMPDNKERAAKPATGHLVKQMPNRAYRQSDLYRLFAHACQRLRCFRMHADDDRRDDAMSLDRDLALEVLESGGDRAYVPVRLLDLDSFVRNYVEIYDKVNDNDRVILLLTRVWFPAQRAALASVNNHDKPLGPFPFQSRKLREVSTAPCHRMNAPPPPIHPREYNVATGRKPPVSLSACYEPLASHAQSRKGCQTPLAAL